MKWIRENIDKAPSFEPFIGHIKVIEENVYSNPALCIETSKSLVEAICKTILTNKNIAFRDDIPFHGLVRLTIDSILNGDDLFSADLVELGRRIASVSQKLAEIRNNAGFATHGLDVLNPRLTETVSDFASKIADVIGGFVLNCYLNNRVATHDHRLHYEDCVTFNMHIDELYPMNTGLIQLSFSEALFTQDYEAYKGAYFDFLTDLENTSEA